MRVRSLTYLRFTLPAALLLAVSACSTTTLRPVEDFSPTTLREEIHVDDTIRATTLSGKVIEARVTGVDADRFHVVTPEGRRLYLEFEVIRSIEVKRISGWKLVAGTGTTLIVLITAAVIYAIVAFFGAL